MKLNVILNLENSNVYIPTPYIPHFMVVSLDKR